MSGHVIGRQLAVVLGMAVSFANVGYAQTTVFGQPSPGSSQPTVETFGQTPVTTPGTTTTTIVTPPPNIVTLSGFSDDYRVGSGDLLEIQVVGHSDLNQTLRISHAGEVSFPLLGLVKVADMTAFDVEMAIGARLTEKKLVLQPEVLVFVRDYQAKPVHVSGAVKTPGQFMMSQDLTVVDAILLAGGLKFNAGDDGLIYRRTGEGSAMPPANPLPNAPPSPGIEIIKVDLRPFKQGRFPSDAVQLKWGDVVVVPDMQMHAFFVVGSVVFPQNFFYPPGINLTASQAISWAGGPLQTAKMSDGMLVRYDASGQRTEMKLDYAAILRGKQQDFPIQPNDIIFIPGGTIKTLAYGMLQLTDTMSMSAAFRIGRSYQMPDAPVRATPP